jgi:hypothetical protein
MSKAKNPRVTLRAVASFFLFLLLGALVGGLSARWALFETEMVRKALGEADGSLFHAMGLQFAFAWAQDRGEVEATRGYVEALLDSQDTLPPLLRPAVCLSAVYFGARHRGGGTDRRIARPRRPRP